MHKRPFDLPRPLAFDVSRAEHGFAHLHAVVIQLLVARVRFGFRLGLPEEVCYQNQLRNFHMMALADFF